jgi:ABC-type dipeptide/oligopeptide/nickel transport system permease subunit
MKQVGSKTARWMFVLVLIVPALSLLAEDPPAAPGQTDRQAQPAATTPVPPALHQALAALLGEPVSLGVNTIPDPPPGSWGIVAEGDGGGGICRDSDSEAEVWLGTDGYGVEAFGRRCSARRWSLCRKASGGSRYC